MRARLICIAACGVLTFSGWFGCGHRNHRISTEDARWTVPPDLVIALSFQELTNNFSAHNRGFRTEVQTTIDSRFALFSRYAHSGIRSFEVFCYERIEDDVWHLRTVHFVHESDSMRVRPVLTNNCLYLLHDGITLYSVCSASDQVVRQRESRLVRGKTD